MFKILKELFCPSKEISITKKSLQKKKKKNYDSWQNSCGGFGMNLSLKKHELQ